MSKTGKRYADHGGEWEGNVDSVYSTGDKGKF